MKVAIVLLSSLALVAPARRYPSGGSGGGFGGAGQFGGGNFGGSGSFGSGGGRYPGSGGGRPIIFPDQSGGIGGGKLPGGHIHDGDHGHGSVGGIGGGGIGGGGIGGGGIGGGGIGGGISQFPRPIGTFPPEALYTRACSSSRNDLVHFEYNGHVYHFSWCADGGQRYTWQGARSYCENLGSGWYPVAVDDRAEDNTIINIIGEHRSPWIWTGGNRINSGNVWRFTDGKNVRYFNWGQTGSLNVPQPDNAENNNEQCLAYLNQFYEGDLITMHDIGCHHEKPTICEHNSGGRGQVPQYG